VNRRIDRVTCLDCPTCVTLMIDGDWSDRLNVTALLDAKL
jgi:hypothetical protein